MASSGYNISATIAHKYAPLTNCSRHIEMQTSKSEFPLKKETGGINIELWLMDIFILKIMLLVNHRRSDL